MPRSASAPPTGPTPPAVRPGDTRDLDERDYRFGRGRLRLRVQAVLGERRLADGVWTYVRGVRIMPDGRDGPQRQILIRGPGAPQDEP